MTEFSSAFDTAKLANQLLSQEFTKTAQKTGLYNAEVAKLADSVKAGTIPIEEAIIALNKLRKEADLGALDLEDFTLDIGDMRNELLKMGIVADEKAAEIVALGDAIDQADAKIKAFGEAIKQVNNAIRDLQIAKLEQAFNLISTVNSARGANPLDTAAAERLQFIRPALGNIFGEDTSGINSLEQLRDFALTPRSGLSGNIRLQNLDSEQLGQVSGLIDRLAENFAGEFETKFSQAQERIAKELDTALKNVADAAKKQAEDLQKAATAGAKAAQAATEASIKGHQARVEQIRDEAKEYTKATNERIKGLQKELQFSQAFAQFAEQLKVTLDQLLTSGSNPLSGTEQFALVGQQLSRARQAGVGATGEDKLNSFADQQRLILQQIQAIPFSRPSTDFADVFNDLVKQLEDLKVQAAEEGEKTQTIDQQLLEVQQTAERHLEDLNTAIEAEADAIEREREALQVKIEAMQDKLDADLQSLELATVKKGEDLEARTAAELDKVRQGLASELQAQLAVLHEISVAIVDRQIVLLEEQKRLIEEEKLKAEAQREQMLDRLTELAQITRDEVVEFLRQIRDGLANPGNIDSVTGRNAVTGGPGTVIPAVLATAVPVGLAGSNGFSVPISNTNTFSITAAPGTDTAVLAQAVGVAVQRATLDSAESGQLQQAVRKGLGQQVT